MLMVVVSLYTLSYFPLHIVWVIIITTFLSCHHNAGLGKVRECYRFASMDKVIILPFLQLHKVPTTDQTFYNSHWWNIELMVERRTGGDLVPFNLQGRTSISIMVVVVDRNRFFLPITLT